MSQTRAGDADRDAAIEVITNAYVDGRLNEIERDIRVEAALRATTLAEIERLIRDLTPATRSFNGSLRTPAQAAHARKLARRTGWILLAVASGILAVVITIAILAGSIVGSAVDRFTTPLAAQDHGPSTGSTTDGPPLHSSAGFEALVEEVRDEAGTTGIDRAVIYPTYASVTSVLPDQERHTETRTFGTTFTGDPLKRSRRTEDPPIDLALVDGDLVERLMRTTPSELFPADIDSVYLIIEHRRDVPTMSVYAQTDYGETGYVTYAFDGTEIIRYAP